MRSSENPPSRTQGVAFRVPDDKADEVLAGLDFRETGYTRDIVDVHSITGEEPNIFLEFLLVHVAEQIGTW